MGGQTATTESGFLCPRSITETRGVSSRYTKDLPGIQAMRRPSFGWVNIGFSLLYRGSLLQAACISSVFGFTDGYVSAKRLPLQPWQPGGHGAHEKAAAIDAYQSTKSDERSCHHQAGPGRCIVQVL